MSSQTIDLDGAPSAPPVPCKTFEYDSEGASFTTEASIISPSSLRASLQGGSVLIRPWATNDRLDLADEGTGYRCDVDSTLELDTASYNFAPVPSTASLQQLQSQESCFKPSPGQSPSKPLLNPSASLLTESSQAVLLPERSRNTGTSPEVPCFSGVTAHVSFSSSSQEIPKKAALTKPSRTAALRKRHAKQLRQYRKDQFGVPILSTARPFSIWASPQKIGEVCAGLGIHLASVRGFVLVALLLSICAIYPLVNNVATRRWQDSYSLVVGEEPVTSCRKPWFTHSWLTSTTVGGHCSLGRFSSAFDCAATCTVSPDRSQTAQCAAQEPPGGSGSQACVLHRPCSRRVADPADPQGPCHCCDLARDHDALRDETPVPAGQLWSFFVGQLVFLCWLLVLARMQLKAMHKVDARVVTASDYAVRITGIIPSKTDDRILREWCCHYGPLVMAANIPTFGPAIKVGKSLEELQTRLAEADARLHEDCPPAPWLLRPWSWLYWTAIVGGRPRLQRQLEAKRLKLEVYQRQEFEPTGTALAVFCYGEHAANCILDHRKAGRQRLLGPLADHCCCVLVSSSPQLAGAKVRVTRAPEPSDVIWEHTSVTGIYAVGRRLWSWTLTVLVMLAGLGLQYGLAVAAEQERERRTESQLLEFDGFDPAAPGAPPQPMLQLSSLRWVAIITGLVVVGVNYCITLVVKKLSVYERWHTRTSLERWTAVKLTVFYLMNSFAVPVLAAYLSSSTTSWFSRGGLMESAFWTQVANALLPPLFRAMDPTDLLLCHLLARFAKTQAARMGLRMAVPSLSQASLTFALGRDMLNWLMAPPVFPLAERYASAVATLGMGLWYMPVLPISPMIAAVGLCMAYCSDKWVSLRRAAHPGNLSGQVTSSAADAMLRLLPLVQLVLIKELYFKEVDAAVPVFWTGLAVWLLFALAPLRVALGLVRHVRTTSTGGLSYQETLLGGSRGGVDDAYMPEVPPDCSLQFRREARAAFVPPPQPLPAIEQPLPYQMPSTGGPATRPPVLRASTAFAPGTLRAALQGAAPQDASPPLPATCVELGTSPFGRAATADGLGPSASVAASLESLGASRPRLLPGECLEGPLGRGSKAWSSGELLSAGSGQQGAPGAGQPGSGLGLGGEPRGGGLAGSRLGMGSTSARTLGQVHSQVHSLNGEASGHLAEAGRAASAPVPAEEGVPRRSPGVGTGTPAPRHVRGETAMWLRQMASWIREQTMATAAAAARQGAPSLARPGSSRGVVQGGGGQRSPAGGEDALGGVQGDLGQQLWEGRSQQQQQQQPRVPQVHQYRQWRWGSGGSGGAPGWAPSSSGPTALDGGSLHQE